MKSRLSSSLLCLGLAVALTGCMTGPPILPGQCMNITTSSLVVKDAEGNTKFAKTADAILYCPPTISGVAPASQLAK